MNHIIKSRPRDERDAEPTKQSTRGKLFGKSVLFSLTNPVPYMVRYFIGRLRLHIMMRGDAGRAPHDHPWWFVTFPFHSYVEEVAYEEVHPVTGRIDIKTRLNVVRRFRFHFRPAHYAHRILGPLVIQSRKIGKTVHGIPDNEMALARVQYRPGMTLDEVDAMLDYWVVPPKKRKIVTIVFRGGVRHSWGFYPVDGPGWVHHKEYFLNNEYDQ